MSLHLYIFSLIPSFLKPLSKNSSYQLSPEEINTTSILLIFGICVLCSQCFKCVLIREKLKTKSAVLLHFL